MMSNELNLRKIIHVDMDAFFASVEQRDHPEWRGKPLAVGHDSTRGVVATASYEARKYGVHSAMSIQTAKRQCPDLIMIKQRIHEETGLTASAGVSYNKFLAKIASDYRKPDGLFVIHPDRALDFIATLPVEDFWGVGGKTAERMHSLGIYNGAQLRSISLGYLLHTFGKAGRTFYDFARGIDDRPVVSERIRKSVGCEHTFSQDICLKSAVIIELYHVTLELVERLQESDFKGHTLTLKVKYGDFTTISRSITQAKVLRTKDDILPLAKKLMSRVDYDANHPIRLIGLAVVNPHAGEYREKDRWIELDIDF